ncbi:CAAD domain-containing protein [Synechococcus sp. NOUM97013]|uniref:CAAD domain-containing protein n=1 Tax=Synechococcus sp. NOUM97013 TaxID=1442555 RepID=UPI00164705EE|nr:CAAD domain-containing protein [Synechococcus sp. NOUM97013]QNI72986.1 hypothetical protein SynNOUM97013_00917 [Synechococcus sp. NOUM97013]
MSSDNSPEIKGTEDTISSDAAEAGAVSATSKAAVNTETDAVIATSEKEITPNEPTASDASASEAAATPENQPKAEPPAPSTSKPAPAAQASAPAAQPSPPTPSIAERVQVPAQAPSGASDESGGEWEMLSGRIKDFWEANNLVEWWQSLRQPLVLVGVLIGLILTLRIYGGILDAIATVPLAPRMFQLVGAIYSAWYAATRLVKSDERKKVSRNLQDIWNSIRGGGKG